ncbi:Biotin carboxyl carrier protein of acetyl-CoA carboxylase [hydrothermal vent metagenome]|uniref:Biotin carboxyl carrier protein of acetyl-CoA carboxylase n=1 Tax=hydrothermal vent metagenome TaxID=652676 RepID=A0A1W1CQQ2_9ZZZZ
MDIKTLKKIIEAFDNSTAAKLNLETKDFKISLDRSVSNAPVVNAQAPQISKPIVQEIEAPTECKVEGDIIKSPMVGTFYRAPSPDAAPFVKEGDKVKKGDTLCIIEAMKIMNELEAEFDCEILEILVENGEPVEFDTPLFRVKRI